MPLLYRFALLVLLASGLSGAGASAATAPPTQAVEFTSTDQDGKARLVKYPREKVSVFVLADQKASSEISGWISPLYARFQERVDITGIAALPGIPSAFHSLFRREFKKRLTYPVMLDWSGDVSRAHGYQKEQVQLLVVSRSGRIALSKTGPATPAALAEVYSAIERLR
jgi:hypothetical protein